MNKLIIIFLSINLFYQLPCLEAADGFHNHPHTWLQCAPPLVESLNAIQKVPEARSLLAEIRKEGPIEIIVNNTALSNQFGAFWDPEQRIISISLSTARSRGSVIGSLLFELHNASVNAEINHLDQLAAQKQISKSHYIRSMEHLEYINSLNAAKIARKGIEMGVLPPDAELPTYSSFAEHFAQQKRSGHSACFGRNYDILSQ